MISLIVDQEQLDRQLVGQNRLQLLKVHHNTSVPFNTYGIFTIICHTCTDGCRQTVSHTCNGTVDNKPGILLDYIIMAAHNAGTAV